MNWKEFKKKVEEQGVTDDTEIDFIDTDMNEPKVRNSYGHVYIT